MADKKYQVFISSTYRDLVDHRADIAKSVLDLRQIPAAMEYFPAMDEDQLRYIKRVIDQCDYYVLVLAGKYGSLDDMGVSYTEREYDYAVEQKKVVLGFPIRDPSKLRVEESESVESEKLKLEAFRAKVMAGRLVREWDSRADLDNKVTKALSAAFDDFPQEGWVRTPKTSSEGLLEEIHELRKQNESLKAQLAEFEAAPSMVRTGLAPLEGSVSFPLEWWDLIGNEGSVQITTTWSALFMTFATFMRGEVGRSSLKGHVEGALANQYGIRHYHRVPEVSFESLLIQFLAHGLFLSDNRKTFSLSKAGLERFVDATVVK